MSRKAFKRGNKNKNSNVSGRVINEKHQSEVKPPVTAKTPIQREMLAGLANYDVVCFLGSAGIGKTYITMSEVSDWIKKGYYDKLLLTRAIIPMGRSLGMLPNKLEDKYEPHLMPMLEVLWNRYGKGWYDSCLSNGVIELLAPEYARGRSISGVMVIDECQNLYPDELYTLITRMEEGSKLILLGDTTQTDIKAKNAIDWLVEFTDSNPSLKDHIKVVHGTSDDIVRGQLCKLVVQAKEKEVANKIS